MLHHAVIWGLGSKWNKWNGAPTCPSPEAFGKADIALHPACMYEQWGAGREQTGHSGYVPGSLVTGLLRLSRPDAATAAVAGEGKPSTPLSCTLSTVVSKPARGSLPLLPQVLSELATPLININPL